MVTEDEIIMAKLRGQYFERPVQVTRAYSDHCRLDFMPFDELLASGMVVEVAHRPTYIDNGDHTGYLYRHYDNDGSVTLTKVQFTISTAEKRFLEWMALAVGPESVASPLTHPHH